jgi:hypothetical protein
MSFDMLFENNIKIDPLFYPGKLYKTDAAE